MTKRRRSPRRARQHARREISHAIFRSKLSVVQFLDPSDPKIPLSERVVIKLEPAAFADALVSVAAVASTGEPTPEFGFEDFETHHKVRIRLAWNQIWDHLGKMAFVQYKAARPHLVKFPTAEEVFQLVELQRRRLFESWSSAMQDPERFLRRLVGRPIVREIAHEVGYTSETEFFENHLIALQMSIALADLMLNYISHRYGVLPSPPTGWRLGRFVEMQIMLRASEGASAFHPCVTEWIKRFYIEPQEAGQFVLTGGEVNDARGENGQGEKQEPYVSRPAPERLLFSMGLSVYREFRALSGANLLNYHVIVYSDDPQTGEPRVGLESPWTGNALYLLRGPLRDCLHLAQSQRRAEIRDSPLYQDRIVHNERWMEKLRDWLGC